MPFAFIPHLLIAMFFVGLWGCEQPRRFSDSFVALRGEQEIPSGVKPPPPRMPAGVTIVDKGLVGSGLGSATPEPLRLPGPDDAPPSPDVYKDQVNKEDVTGPEPTQYGPGALSANLEFAVIGPARIAQTFRVVETVTLTRIAWRLRVNHTNTAAGTLSLHAVGASGTPSGDALVQARVAFVPQDAKPLPWSEHAWENPVLLKKEQEYAWVLQPEEGYSVNVSAGDDRAYRAGTGWVAAGGEDVWSAANVDFTFQTYVAPDTARPHSTSSAPLNISPNTDTSDGNGASNSTQSEPRG